MAFSVILRIGDTSTYDVSLTSSGVSVDADLPWLNAPDIDQQAIQNLGDGNSLSVPRWTNVTESIGLDIRDSTAALVAAKVQSIERVLDLARQGSLGHLHDKVYLRVQFDHDSLVWRSQILAARLEMERGADQIWRKYVRAVLIITRRYYFETEAMQAVEVWSSSTAATTGYATLYNADDATSNRNYINIEANQVLGSLPAPAKIYLKNTSGATRNAAAIFLGNYVLNPISSYGDYIYRSAEADGGDTTPGTTEDAIRYWELDSGALVDAFRGQFGRWVAVWSDLPANTTMVRASLQYRGPSPVVDLALGEQMLNTSQHHVQDLGGLPIPPARWASGMGDRLYLAIKGQAASGTDTADVDWLQIFPTGFGRYRVLQGMTGSIAPSANDEVIDDGPNEVVYLLTSATSETLPLYRPLYAPIHLWPNRFNRITMIVSSGAFSFEPDEAWGMKVEMKYRRMSF